MRGLPTKPYSIRLTEFSRIALTERAKSTNMKISDFINNLIIENPISIIEISSPELEKHIEKIPDVFNKMGSNINQIATKLNSGENINNEDIEVIKKASSNIEKLIKILSDKKETKITKI